MKEEEKLSLKDAEFTDPYTLKRITRTKKPEYSDRDTLEIIQGIAQAASNAYDGSHADDGKGEDYYTWGMRRENYVDFRDRRLIDGFKIAMAGNVLILSYQSEINLKEVYQNKFEDNINAILDDCISFLKREYKRFTKKTLGLKLMREPELRVEHLNNYRSWVVAKCYYKIEGIDLHREKLGATWQERLAKAHKDWLGLKRK